MFRKLLLLSAFVCLVHIPALADGELDQVSKALNDLEQKWFGQQFSSDLVSTRVDRLEQKILNRISSGSIKTRIDTLLVREPDSSASTSAASAPTSADSATMVDFGPYLAQTQQAVHSKWKPPKGRETKTVVLVVRVDREGGIRDIRITSSSGVPDLDESGIEAVKKAMPFPALPAGSPLWVDAQYTLEYKVTPNNKHK